MEVNLGFGKNGPRWILGKGCFILKIRFHELLNCSLTLKVIRHYHP